MIGSLEPSISTPDSLLVTTGIKRSAHTETPVDSQMDRDDEVLVGEDVHLARPPSHRSMTSLDQLGVKKCVEGISLAVAILLPTFHQHVHVEVDHLAK